MVSSGVINPSISFDLGVVTWDGDNRFNLFLNQRCLKGLRLGRSVPP